MNADQVLENAVFSSDGAPYVLVKLPAAAIIVAASIVAEIGAPFCTLIVDRHEVTLVVPDEAVEEFAARLHGHEVSKETFRLITLDTVMPLDVVGVMARLSAALAKAQIPIFAFAAYSRDHVLVPASHFEAAMSALNNLKAT